MPGVQWESLTDANLAFLLRKIEQAFRFWNGYDPNRTYINKLLSIASALSCVLQSKSRSDERSFYMQAAFEAIFLLEQKVGRMVKPEQAELNRLLDLANTMDGVSRTVPAGTAAWEAPTTIIHSGGGPVIVDHGGGTNTVTAKTGDWTILSLKIRLWLKGPLFAVPKWLWILGAILVVGFLAALVKHFR